MTKEEYKKAKISSLALPAAGVLLLIQGYAFITGLHVGFDDFDWVVGVGMFLTLLAIQLIGNDLTFEDDAVFYVGWLFSYIVEISAGTWTFYNVFSLPNEYMRWILAFGVSGIVAILPERLIYLWTSTRKKKVDTVSTARPANSDKPSYNKTQPVQQKGKDSGKPVWSELGGKPKLDFMKSHNNQSKPQNNKPEPTYRPLNLPRWNEKGE